MEDSVLIAFDAHARAKVDGYIQGLHIGHRHLWKRFRNITNFSKGRSLRPSRLGTWKEFANLESGLPIRSLEPDVAFMRISDGKFIRTISNPKLPINLATPAGAKVIGYRGDVHHSNSSFTNKNPVLHEDYRRCVTTVVGDISITETLLDHGGFTTTHYLRTNVGYFITRLATIAGLENGIDQPHANNPAPVWLVRCDDDTIGAYLAALWDAEGSVNEHDIKLSQAVSLQWLPTSVDVPYWPSRITPNQLEEQSRRYVIERPPLLLVSAAILLSKFGIVSHLQPIGLSRSGSDIKFYWQLRIHKTSDARIFRDKIKLLSHNKLQTLNTWLDTT